MAKILVVDDDENFAQMVVDWLESEHHTVERCNNGLDGLQMVEQFTYDLLVLDWNMPEMSGVELCSAYRAKGGASPVLMLTALGAVENKMTGLDAGADDYICKPCDLREVSARVRALLRRPTAYEGEVLKFAYLTLKPSSFELEVDGKNVKLLPKEFALIEFFMRHPNRAFSADEILSHVWKSEATAGPETVRTWIMRLRQKIAIDGGKSLIQSIYGVGYKLSQD